MTALPLCAGSAALFMIEVYMNENWRAALEQWRGSMAPSAGKSDICKLIE